MITAVGKAGIFRDPSGRLQATHRFGQQDPGNRIGRD
jgi:hypothetical protein